MKKTISVNIGGSVFQMDEDAHRELDAYIRNLKNHFSGVPDAGEILDDMERRIAEMFSGRLNANKQVINMEDVREVIGILGRPGEFNAGTNRETAGGARTQQKHRIFRDGEHKVIGGVCAGLGAHFNTDPVWFRLGFVVLTIILIGTGLLVYLILWAVLPEAVTSAEKEEMQGKAPELKDIEDSIREELMQLKEKLISLGEEARKTYRRMSGNP
ncbi:MAG: PspC domain-containing protein [Bacteroidales bacterium]|nr:PspC domain-containing protein [Bacteroidales bacterium]